jgi:hypothetical protein
MTEKLINMVYRVIFVLAGILFVLAIWEKIINSFSYKMSWIPFDLLTMFELSAIFVLFVIALLLRQIRDILRK